MFRNKNIKSNGYKFLLAAVCLILVVVGFQSLAEYNSRVGSNSQAAGPVIGYGCYGFGDTESYGSCVIKLRQEDISSLNDLYTVDGVVCTPNPAEINTEVSCVGTLGPNRAAPQGTLYLGFDGLNSIPCVFNGNIFNCNNIPTGPNAGSLKLYGNIDTNAKVDTTVVVNAINHILNSDDIVAGNLLSTTGPFDTITCGGTEGITVSVPTTCTFQLRTGFEIPNDFKVGIGTNPGGQCVVSAQTLTCTNVPVAATAGTQGLKVQIGSGSISNPIKTFDVKAMQNTPTTNPVTTPPSSTPNLVTTLLPRTGGEAIVLGIVLIGLIFIITGTMIYLRSKKK